MEGFFTFVFILILLFWILIRLLPFLLRWWVKRGLRNFESGFHHNNKERKKENIKEGEVTIEVNEAKHKVVDNSIGEYVDYEETK